MLTSVLPLLMVGVSFAAASRLERRIPTRLSVYRFHAIAYPIVTVLGLVTVALMGLSPSVDWWVDDAAVYLELMFGISGVALCIMLVPIVWWLERGSDLSNAWRIGRMAVSTVTLLPYIIIAGIMLFYHE